MCDTHLKLLSAKSNVLSANGRNSSSATTLCVAMSPGAEQLDSWRERGREKEINSKLPMIHWKMWYHLIMLPKTANITKRSSQCCFKMHIHYLQYLSTDTDTPTDANHINNHSTKHGNRAITKEV